MIDAFGKFIGKHNLTTIDISQIQTGIYFLQIEFSESVIITQKIVKK